MTDGQIAVFSLLVGGIISAVVSWFFYRRSVDKKLSVYIQFASPVLGGIDDPEVRQSLQIHYRNNKIDDLLPLQFVVANEGQKAIRDFIEPLTLTLPKTARLLEARVIHVEPAGREVSLQPQELADGRTRVAIQFKLLNKSEFFFVKMLINGKLDPDDLAFTLSVDDLPPTIKPKPRPFRASEDEPTTGVSAIFLGLVPLGVAIATGFGMLALSQSHPELFPGDQRFRWFSWPTLAIATWLGGIIYWIVRGTHLVIARGILGPKHRFHIPRRVQTEDFDPLLYDRHRRLLIRDHPDYFRRYYLEERMTAAERRQLYEDLVRRRHGDAVDPDNDT